MELRERRVASQSNVSSAVPKVETPHLVALSDEQIKERKLPELKFKPLMLRTASLCTILVFNLLILGLLVTLCFKREFYISSRWSYILIQILPPVLGTITAGLWVSISTNFSRITPFVLAAASSGSPFQKTILGSYFPGLSLKTAFHTGNKLLSFIWILQILAGTVLSFKSSLLNTVDYTSYVHAIVTSWALYALISVYCLLILFTAILIWKLHDRVTGLIWDVATIADHIMLVRNSNFLDDFEGTDTAERKSIEDRLHNKFLKLGYWFHREEIWYGFGKISKQIDSQEEISTLSQPTGTSEESRQTGSVQPNTSQPLLQGRNGSEGLAPKSRQKYDVKKFTMQEVVATRYRSVVLNMESGMAYIWVSITLALISAFVIFLILGFVEGREVYLSYNWATLIFQFLPTFVATLYTWFWEEVDLFARTTQPFRGMYKPKPVTENLLLDYGCLPPIVTTYFAFKNSHWKIAWTSVVALVQRLLPILVAGSTTVVPYGSVTWVYASMPLSICIIVWLSMYVILIPLEIFSWQLPGRYTKRHLPRCFSSIADLISWTYASNIVRGVAGSPFDVPVKGPKSEKWYMEARLRLKESDIPEEHGTEEEEEAGFALYSFGLYESATHKGVNCIGFDVNSNVISVPDGKRTRSESSDAENGDQETFKMLSPKDLRHLLASSKERSTNLKTIGQRPPPQEEDSEAQQEQA